jgi:hypothetical protein
MASGNLVIEWRSPDGEEHEERWDTIDAFLSWAAGDGASGQYAAYEEDEDGDLVLIERGAM